MSELQLLSKSQENILTSLNPESKADKKKLYNCINSPDDAISDMVGKHIKISDYVAHEVEIENDKGEKVRAVRLVLIDDKNKTYATVSDGAVQALSKIFSIFGTPDTWDEPIEVKVVEKKSRKFKFITFEVV